MSEALPCVKCNVHLRNWWRNVDRGGFVGSRCADVILDLSEFSGRAILTAHPCHEYPMKFPDKSQGKRDGIQLLHAEIECAHVVVDLAYAVADIPSVFDLVDEHVGVAGDSAFYMRRQPCFDVQVRTDQKGGVCQLATHP